MRNIINRCSSRMGLAVALLVIFVIACQMLPGSLAVDKGRVETAPARVYPFVTHRHGPLRPNDPSATNLVREDASNISSFAVGNLSVNSLAEPGDGTCDLTECTLREARRQGRRSAPG
ncbi:MAG: hypothetical protein M3R52_01515 [Acidobacteriota bacterium]|nr:hypothetical protein [Acidobacteriota bacterium]